MAYIKRYIFNVTGIIIFFLCFLPVLSYAQGVPTVGATDYEKLKKDYDALLLDYNNVLAQAKSLMVYKNKARDMEDGSRQSVIEKEQLVKDKENILKQVAELNDRIKNLDETIVRLTQERDNYKKSFEKASVENIIGADTKKKITGLEKEKEGVLQKTEDLQLRIKAMEYEALKKQAELELCRRQLIEIKAKYSEAKRQNNVLEKKLEDMPGRFTELARENKILVKRTAMMHYNLGVFYTQNREYERALSEFEKAVELNPDDSASYFNLGYIYSEHLQNRPKAVNCFRQFLKLAKKDDKDADWAKKYILTWQTWEGDVPVK